MLRLVVDNTKKINMNALALSCRNSCELFDSITESCSIKENVNVDSSYETSRCGHFLNYKATVSNRNNHISFKFSLIGEEEDYLIDDEEIFHELIGKQFKKMENSAYPVHPDYPSKRDDAEWYVSPCGTFGCWIINEYRRPLPIPASLDQAEKGWGPKVYKSPFPLHDHKSSLSLASKMAWVIDDEGYGMYALLVNGKVSTISSPKPVNWGK